MSRLTMAAALIGRADTHRRWIGDDHGDPIETAMLTATIPDEMQIVAKEAMDHLRAALDYCAREVWEHFSGQPTSAKIYFPIAREGAVEADFLSLMNRLMPGVPAQSNDALEMFASFQVFRDPTNVWLPELASLSNEAKHENLVIAEVPNRVVRHTKRDGILFSEFEPGDAPKRSSGWMALEPIEKIGEREERFRPLFVVLSATNVELSLFLKEAVAGTRSITSATASLLGRPNPT